MLLIKIEQPTIENTRNWEIEIFSLRKKNNSIMTNGPIPLMGHTKTVGPTLLENSTIDTGLESI